jgi:hypothetical protein
MTATVAELMAALRVATMRKVEVAGLSVYVRGLTGGERKLLMQRAKDGSPLEANELVVLCACNEKGDPIFSEADAAALDTVDGGCLNRLAEQILSASGLLPDAVETSAKN